MLIASLCLIIPGQEEEEQHLRERLLQQRGPGGNQPEVLAAALPLGPDVAETSG